MCATRGQGRPNLSVQSSYSAVHCRRSRTNTSNAEVTGDPDEIEVVGFIQLNGDCLGMFVGINTFVFVYYVE